MYRFLLVIISAISYFYVKHKIWSMQIQEMKIYVLYCICIPPTTTTNKTTKNVYITIYNSDYFFILFFGDSNLEFVQRNAYTYSHTHIHGIGNEVPTRSHAHKINARTSSMPFRHIIEMYVYFSASSLFSLHFSTLFLSVCKNDFNGFVCLLVFLVCFCRRRRFWTPQFCFCCLYWMLFVNFVSDQIYSLFLLPYIHTIFPYSWDNYKYISLSTFVPIQFQMPVCVNIEAQFERFIFLWLWNISI